MTNRNFPEDFPKIMGIFGTGRSGSSWLGSIVDSHPQVAYRFEPFHRLKQTPHVSKLCHLLEFEPCQNSDLAKAYNALLSAHPVLERPPFFPKTYGSVWGKSWLRAPTLKFKILNPLYQWLYTPTHSQPTLVFKEVTMERMMTNLLTYTSMPVVYLVRHPCAVVSSTLTGQKQGVMPTGRHSVLADIMKKHDPVLAAQYGLQVERMDLLEKETLLWRMDVEKGIAAAKEHENALIVIYETLCDDPQGVSKQVFEHFGLEFSEQTANYLDSLTQNHQKPSRPGIEFGVKSYFSVIRNPAEMKDKWKQKLTTEEQQRILALVQDSVAFQFCASYGNW